MHISGANCTTTVHQWAECNYAKHKYDKAYFAEENGSNAAITALALNAEAMFDAELGIWFLDGSCGDLDSCVADGDRANILSVGRGRIRWL